jgi:uncharacterized protein (TIGR02421 family)
MTTSTEAYHQALRRLSDRIVKAQQPIRILDAIKWGPEIQQDFFDHKCKKMPKVDAHYYQKNPLPYDPEKKKEEFYELERDIRREVGHFSSVGTIMQRMCREYREVVRMISARGLPEFSKISQELYGSSSDAFYVDAPRLRDLAAVVTNALAHMKDTLENEKDEKRYTSEEVVAILKERLDKYFDENQDEDKTKEKKIKVRVKISDGIIADAAAGAESIRIRRGAMFSERDIRILEVHEGWVHMGTTLNGMEQPICTFLSKGAPSSTITQEGLAIIMEIFDFASYPRRIARLTNRVTAISLAEDGANFLDIFNFFHEKGLSKEESYNSASRIFRGSTPELGPFTKDLVYSKGFILIYNYLRLAIQRGLLSRIPLLFTGKTALEDQRILAHLVEEGLVVPPKYVPRQFKDLAALSAWMSYSVFLNRLNLDWVAHDYRDILEG